MFSMTASRADASGHSSSLLCAMIIIILIASITLPERLYSAGVSDHAAPGEMVQVGEHRLHLLCMGDGGPTVVLESGLGGNSLDWVKVQPLIAKRNRVCTYDRAGYGWSELGPLPRTSERIADELHTLLERARIPGPYILVGHSFGGYSVRLFAVHFPNETAGLILVDAAHEDQFSHFKRYGIARHTAGANIMISGPKMPENLPEEAREVAQSLVETTDAVLALRGETLSFRRSAQQVRDSGALPDVPMVVITRGKRVWPENERGDRMESIWRDLQEDLALRALPVRSSVGASHLFAYESGHYIHLDEPELVVSVINDVVKAGRNKLF